MSDNPIGSLETCFGDIHDPRVQGRCEYPLLEIIPIAICAVIAGADTWTEIETFGKSKEAWLKQFLQLEHGIPSHDTFGDVFRVIDAEAFQRSFMRWVECVFQVTEGQVVAIDGKTVRRSHDRTIGKEAIHMVSAWASTNGITLGQRKVDDKSNEITAIPELLRLLNVAGCIVTIDAMGCQTAIAQAIRDEKADYVLHVKANQGHLHQDLEDWFVYADQVQSQAMQHDYHLTINKGHGRSTSASVGPLLIRSPLSISATMMAGLICRRLSVCSMNGVYRIRWNKTPPTTSAACRPTHAKF